MKLDWLPTAAAYKLFPMFISKAAFINEDNSLVTFSKNSLVHNGWANVGSIEITDFEKKKIPVRLSLKWFSLIEDKSFGVDIELDKNKISSILNRYDAAKERFYFTVGMAPKGMLYLWIICGGATELVQTYQAGQIENDWKILFPDIEIEKSIFVDKSLEQLLTKHQIDSSRSVLNSGSNVWKDRNLSNYGINYSVESDFRIDNTTILFFDGEFNSFKIKGNKFEEKLSDIKSVPKNINFYWNENNEKYNLEIDFDEDELFQAINRLHKLPDSNLQLIFTILKTGAVQVIVKNGQEFYEFKKVKLQLYK